MTNPLLDTLKGAFLGASILAAVTGGVIATDAVTAPAEASAMQLCVVNVALNDVLNVRTGPGSSFRIIHTLAPGSCVTTTGETSGNWIRINTPSGTGWSHGRYLSADAGGDDGIGGGYTEDLLRDGTYCPEIAHNDVLNVREGPGVQYPIIGFFRPEYCEIQGTGRCLGNWCETANHEFTGWVNTRYLRNVESGH